MRRACVLAPMAPSGAAPLEREHYSFHDEDQFIDDECGEAMTIDYTADGSGVFMLKQGRRGDPTPYFFDNYYSVETYTNVENGATATIVHQGLFKDLQIEHVEGHDLPVHRDRDGPAGHGLRTRWRAADLRCGTDPVHGPHRHARRHGPGQRRVPRRREDPSVAGPHPVFVGEVDFCDLLDVLR